MQIGLPFSTLIASFVSPSTPPSSSTTSHLRPPPPAPPLPSGSAYTFLFVRHPRAKRYLLRLNDEGVVRVTIPRWGSKREALAFAERERAWLDHQWSRVQADRSRPKPPAEDPAIEQALRRRAKQELPTRLQELAARHGLAGAVTKISVRNQRWRWGSCAPSGHICLNWRLVRMPDAVRDYVLIHELMHLKRMDHSKKFWKFVEQACPDYRELRRALREAGALLR